MGYCPIEHEAGRWAGRGSRLGARAAGCTGRAGRRRGAGMARKAQRAGRGSRLGRWAARRAVSVRMGADVRGRARACPGVRGQARTGTGARRACMRRQASGRTSEHSALGAGSKQRATGRSRARGGARQAGTRGAAGSRGTAPRRGLGAACARGLGQLGQFGVLCTLTRFFWPGSTR